MKKIIVGIFISILIITSTFSAAVVMKYEETNQNQTAENNIDNINTDNSIITELENKNEKSVDDISLNNLQSSPLQSINTSIDEISPYNITYSPYTITATGASDLDNVTLYYRWSDDNIGIAYQIRHVAPPT